MSLAPRLAAVFCGACACASAQAQAQAPQLAYDQASGIAWACGGVGADDRAALRALEPQANVKLAFLTAKRGGYLAGAAVAVGDGKAVALRLTADGPYCLLRLRPGSWRIEAELGGVRRTANAVVRAEVGRPQALVFSYPGEPWDGIRASDEEKRQARE